MEPAPIKIRILIIDDQLVVREGLRMLIENHPGTKVVAMARTRTEALDIIAREMGVNLKQTSGPVLERAGDPSVVALFVARITRKVFVRAELFRVDEDRNDHDVRHLASLFDQAQVSLVQSTHRRHETHRLVLTAQLAHDRRHSLFAIDNFHRVNGKKLTLIR